MSVVAATRTATDTAASERQNRVRQAQGLLGSGQAAAAAKAMQALLREAPNDSEARYTLAVAQRLLRDWRGALANLAKVAQARPRFGRAQQEAGYNHLALRQPKQAQAAFDQAVALDPSLLQSWEWLAKLCERQSGAAAKARCATAKGQVAFLKELPPELRTVVSYLSEDRLADAERLCKHFLRGNKTHVEGMRLLAEIATRNRALDDAEFLLESCVEFEPDHRAARIQYGNILLRVQKFAKAHEQAERLLAEQPDDDGTIRALYAAACNGVGKRDEAVASYQRLMAAQPENPAHAVSLAHVHKAAGELDDAVALYRKAYGIKRDHGDAYWSLANTKSYRFEAAEVAQMAALVEDAATAELDRIQLCFALGTAFEARGDYAAAFQHFAKGNALKQASASHSAAQLAVRVESQLAVCDQTLFAERDGVGCPAPDPIFIVGLPRAGSTLIEQILASHSQVDGTMELHNVLNLAKRLRGRDEVPDQPRYPRILRTLEADYFRRFGEQFLADTRPYRGTAPKFIDKMPNNFFHIGLIRLILPNAKVIDARRHPLACCVSGFKQLFGEGQEFSYGLKEIGNYYREYVRLMDHWDAVLPGFVLRVQHEAVVDDLAGQVRRLLDFCGLPFEPACLEYHRTERSVYTPSAEQVRRPIYRDGLEQWRHYEPWLGPLKEALGPEVRARYEIG